MQTYELTLKAPISDSFYAEKAKASVDLNAEEKAWHHLKIDNIDLDAPYSIGLIYGASGSGKTTLAKHIFKKIDVPKYDPRAAVIDQFPETWEYEDRQRVLNAIGLSQIPCWIKPVGLLSNGQQERAKIALMMCEEKEVYVFDEWTSIIDRTVAKVMSHSIQKFARKQNRKIILVSCHADVIEWLDPDWVIDCNEQKFIDRRDLVGRSLRQEKLNFEIRTADKASWHMFSKYHYLSDNLPGGLNIFYGLFLNDKQIGFQAFSEYTPWKGGFSKRILHSNRTVIHPDYVGLGLGIVLINKTSAMVKDAGYRVMAKYSALPVYRAMLKYKEWVFLGSSNFTPSGGGNMNRVTGYRDKVKTYKFEYVGDVGLTEVK